MTVPDSGPQCPVCDTPLDQHEMRDAFPERTHLRRVPGERIRGADVVTTLLCAECGSDVELAVSITLSSATPDGFEVTTTTAPIEEVEPR